MAVPRRKQTVWNPVSVSSNAVPSLFAPPADVVPKRFPAASAVRPACGCAPSVPLKLSRMVGVPA